MQEPLVSVIIPAYNHEKYIQETVESIVNQTYQHIELLVIDDGSKDLTYKMLQLLQKKHQNRFSRFYIEHQENKGTCETINKLLSLAEGKYVYLIASDDKARPECIEMEAAFLENNPEYALCVGNNEFIDANSQKCYVADSSMTPKSNFEEGNFRSFASYIEYYHQFSFKSDIFGTYKKIFKGNHVPNGYLIRKSIFEKIGMFTKEAPLEDYWLMLQISKYWKIKYINRILFSYRLHGANTSCQREKMLIMTGKTLEYEIKLLLSLPDEELCQDARDVKLNLIAQIKNKDTL